MANLRSVNIYNVTLTNANAEYSQALPPNVRSLEVLAETAVDVRVAFVTGKVATPTRPYVIVKAGSSFGLDNLQLADDATVYFGTATAGTVVDIITGSW